MEHTTTPATSHHEAYIEFVEEAAAVLALPDAQVYVERHGYTTTWILTITAGDERTYCRTEDGIEGARDHFWRVAELLDQETGPVGRALEAAGLYQPWEPTTAKEHQ